MNSVTERERKACLEVDRFVLANIDTFQAAVESLKPMFSNGDKLDDLLYIYGLTLGHDAFRERSILETMPGVCVAPLIVAYLHLTAGTPLYIDDTLLIAWHFGGKTPRECLACGYRFPSPCPKCSLCGGQIGAVGSWQARKARTAGWN